MLATGFLPGVAVAPITIAIAIIVLVGLAIWLGIHYENKRTEKLSEVAASLGLDFSTEGDSMLYSKMGIFPVFNKGRARKIKNVMRAETEDTSLAIFEYQYTTGGGKNSQTHRFTLAAMDRKALQLPQFTVRPEGFLDRIGSALGFQDINFDDHPGFSNAFVLQGRNEEAIRQFFNTSMLDLFAARKGSFVEAEGSQLTFRKQGRISPEQIADFMAEAYEFLNAFEQQ